MTDPALRQMTEQEYLAWDGPRHAKWEYVDGFVYAQAGAGVPHNRIASNIQGLFIPASRGRDCWSYASDMKVRAHRAGRTAYYLPDIVVVCESKLVGDVETQPCLIVEILSASTRTIDLTYKTLDYQQIPSLQGYLVVDSERRNAFLYRRHGDEWLQEDVQGSLELPCLNITVGLDDLYAGTGL